MEIERLLDKAVLPSDLMDAVKADRKCMSMYESVAGSGEKFKVWRECWLAASFGLAYIKNLFPFQIEVLSGTDFPDFKVHWIDNSGNKVTEDFESVSVLQDNRRMGAEYKKLEKYAGNNEDAYMQVTNDEMLENEAKLPALLKNEIHKKMNKYENEVIRNTNLLVYINAGVWTVDINNLREQCKEYEDTFMSIWLLNSGKIGTLFKSNRSNLKSVDEFVEMYK